MRGGLVCCVPSRIVTVQDDERATLLRRQRAAGHVALAELYMSDLWCVRCGGCGVWVGRRGRRVHTNWGVSSRMFLCLLGVCVCVCGARQRDACDRRSVTIECACSFEEDAEEQCQRALDAALAVDPDCPEAFQVRCRGGSVCVRMCARACGGACECACMGIWDDACVRWCTR